MLPHDAPNNAAVKVLRDLCRRADRARLGARSTGITPSWQGDGTAQALGYAILEHAQKIGAVRIKRPKGQEHVIDKVYIEDADILAQLIGHERATHQANTLLNVLDPLIREAPLWLQDELEQALLKWDRGERAFRIAATDRTRIVHLVKLLIAIDRGVDGRDKRSFNAKAGVPSKTFEEHQGTILEIMRRAYGYGDMPADQLMEELGFKPFHHPIHIQAPIKLTGTTVDLSDVHPYIAIPPSAAGTVELIRPIRAVLTIENFASFNRHVMECADPTVATIYSGGFPSPPVLETLCALHTQAGSIPHYHWGDIDGGGVRIFKNIEDRIGKAAIPHLMSIGLAEALGVMKNAIPALAKIAQSNSGIAELAAYLAQANPHHLEQENIDPAIVPLLT